MLVCSVININITSGAETYSSKAFLLGSINSHSNHCNSNFDEY